jgi:predicted AAA+ superfamily ATPase
MVGIRPRGRFPLSLLAAAEAYSVVWRQQFLHSFLERDLLQFHPDIAPAPLMRFESVLALYHART